MDDRQIRGAAIIAKGDMPTELGQDQWRIPSQNGGGTYGVAKGTDRFGLTKWTCTCPDHTYRNVACKHIHAIQFWMQLRQGQKPTIPESIAYPEPVIECQTQCVYCGSLDVRKDGCRKTRHGKKQRLECKSCDRKFTIDAEFGKLSANPEILTVVLDLFYKGVSTRKISDHLRQFHKVEVDHSTVYRWVIKYTERIHEYTTNLQPQTGRIWNSDEMMINVGGKKKWQWNIMDKDSRFMLNSHITDKRFVKDADTHLKKARKQAGKAPDFLFTDGLQSYIKANKKQMYNTNHIRCPSIRSHRENNNVVERYHNTVRERDRVIRSYKSNKTAQTLVDGFNDYYNYIREHQGLGTTPAQQAGISLQLGQNKWMGLLKQSLMG